MKHMISIGTNEINCKKLLYYGIIEHIIGVQ